jgi:2-hydroxychromene-2-carboxylate isomerase
LPDFVRTVFHANFAEDRDIASPQVISDCLQSLGQSGMAVIEEAQSPTSKAQLRTQTEQAVALGMFGAPTFLVGDELFWGNDRLEAALAWSGRSIQMGC